jgi:hypothetical protein
MTRTSYTETEPTEGRPLLISVVLLEERHEKYPLKDVRGELRRRKLSQDGGVIWLFTVVECEMEGNECLDMI